MELIKKKILFIYGQLNGGGAERVLLDILHHLDYSKYEVDLCQIIYGGTLIGEVPQEVNIIHLWSNYALSYKLAVRLSNKLRCDYLFKRVLRKKIEKNYDVEISFLEGFPLKIHAMLDSVARKITWVHCDLYRFHYTVNQFREGEELIAYNKMNKIVCVSNDSKFAFEKQFPMCLTEKVVIYNPIDRERILRMSEEFVVPKNDCFTIVSVGRLTSPKRMDRIIRLARRFKDENVDVQFQIIGDGELKSDLLSLRSNLHVEDMVTFLGFKKNPFPYIKSADMMFCCSGYEGFCLVICEAMCLGVPVVSTKTSGPIEILDNNQYGLLTEHDDDSIYSTVKKMIEDESLRRYYKNKGLIRVDKFCVSNVLKQIEEL